VLLPKIVIVPIHCTSSDYVQLLHDKYKDNGR